MNSLTITPHGLVLRQGRSRAWVLNQAVIASWLGCSALTRGSCHASVGRYYCGVVTMQPIGPEASSVYWVRRAAFLVIVLIVLFGLIGIIRAVAGGG